MQYLVRVKREFFEVGQNYEMKIVVLWRWEVYHTIYSSVTQIRKPIQQQEEWRQQIN